MIWYSWGQAKDTVLKEELAEVEARMARQENREREARVARRKGRRQEAVEEERPEPAQQVKNFPQLTSMPLTSQASLPGLTCMITCPQSADKAQGKQHQCAAHAECKLALYPHSLALVSPSPMLCSSQSACPLLHEALIEDLQVEGSQGIPMMLMDGWPCLLVLSLSAVDGLKEKHCFAGHHASKVSSSRQSGQGVCFKICGRTVGPSWIQRAAPC